MKGTISVIKRVVILLIAAVFVFSFAGCRKEKSPSLDKCSIIHELEFGGVYVKMTIDDFNALGFKYGDSVDVTFSNGYTLKDIPYYNGYYTANSHPLLIAYPGYDYIKVAINNGDDLYKVAELDEEKDVATISVHEKGKYLEIQEARDIHYQDERDKYPSDEVFANFRAMKVGKLKENIFYRSASPCDNQHNRAPYVDKLMEQAGVKYIVNLADTKEKIAKYMSSDDFSSPYFKSLYESGNVILLDGSRSAGLLGLNMNYESEGFRREVAAGLAEMAHNEGPYLVHCTEGKDRTGYMCILLEALAGGTYEEIRDDYMVTYYKYYEISTSKEADKYNTIVENLFDPMLQSIAGEGTDIKIADLAAYAEKMLLDSGMSEDDLQLLKDRILD